MASDALFSKLADALSQPSKTYRAVQEGLQIPGSAIGGYEQGLKTYSDINQLKNGPKLALAQRQSALLDNFGKLAESTNLDTAKKLMGPALQNVGVDVSSFSDPSSGASLSDMEGQFEKNPMAFNPKQRQMLATSRNANASNAIKQQMADAMEQRVNVMQKGQELSAQKAANQFGGAGAAQGALKESFSRIANIQRARGLLDQIKTQGGKANLQQRAELASAAARTLNPTGVMTNEALNLFLPETAAGKYGNFIQYLQNAPEDVNFAPFAGRFGDLLNREEGINKGIINSGGQYAQPFERFGAKIPTAQASAQPATPPAQTSFGDPEADAAIAQINSAPISNAEKQARVNAVMSRARAK